MPELSNRALRNIAPNETWNIMGRVFMNPWSENNPDGIVAMGIAENKLMHSEIATFLNSHFGVTPNMLTYGDGPSGSHELRDALSEFINDHFSPREKLAHEHVTIMNGVSSVIDALCFCIAEPGDGILIARPLYVGFLGDFEDRAGVKPIYVSIGNDDVAGMAAVSHHEKALIEAEQSGTKVKGLMLCNPHNPLGRCYSKEVIGAYLALCSKYNIHFISDEVYARGIFPSTDIPDPKPFTSVLSLEIEKFIDSSLVHVLYGMSKDFCSNGLRVGAFISQHNPTLHVTMSSVAKFSWASSMSDRAWTLILTDKSFLTYYFSEMQHRMTTAYELCTSILKQWGINYVPASCGPFIWVDLGKFMLERTIGEERKLARRMLDCGVWLATGEAFISEVSGWFRITFAVHEEDLRLGIERLQKALGVQSSDKDNSG